jgi:hypothetical protein
MFMVRSRLWRLGVIIALVLGVMLAVMLPTALAQTNVVLEASGRSNHWMQWGVYLGDQQTINITGLCTDASGTGLANIHDLYVVINPAYDRQLGWHIAPPPTLYLSCKDGLNDYQWTAPYSGLYDVIFHVHTNEYGSDNEQGGTGISNFNYSIRITSGSPPVNPPPPTTPAPTEEPTAAPTEEPTAAPTEEPTAALTEEPTAAPTEEPTAAPTEEPTVAPTKEPTAAPTEEPTAAPTEEPTAAPTEEPTAAPTEEPTAAPTEEPTATPSEEPAAAPPQTMDEVVAGPSALPNLARGAQPDGRLNWRHGDFEAAIYRGTDSQGQPSLVIYGIGMGSRGYLLCTITEADLGVYASSAPEINTLIKTCGGTVTAYVLNTGEIQVNIVHDGKVWVTIMDSLAAAEVKRVLPLPF